jgi:hypothetical protein
MTTQSTTEGTSAPVNFSVLRKVNVNDHIKKKGNLSYLSWAYAVDELLQLDSTATWEYRFGKQPITSLEATVFLDVPYVLIGSTAMVFCTVHAFGVSRTAQLPVMDNRNKPIPNPDSFQLNNAMQRCLVKAIALHGLGLYIYEGEDIPEEDKEPPKPKLTIEQIAAAKKTLGDCKTIEALRDTFNALDEVTREVTKEYALSLRKKIESAAAKAE